MKYTGWIDYAAMSIAVQEMENGYRCLKYVGSSRIRNADVFFENLDEMKSFLLEIPNAPEDQIEYLLERLHEVAAEST
ncbi:hypothetical protein JYT25_00870 [bacterium AH-315-C20]|nr:hypothetical protein [bacterium AH-315-C20]